MSEIVCKCGSVIKECNQAKHENSKKHRKFEIAEQIDDLQKMIDYHDIYADSWWLFADNEEGTKAHRKCVKFVQKLCVAKHGLKQLYKNL